MTRLMGDAIHDQVPALAQVPGLQLVAGYVTGSPDIQWTTADWARFPLATQLTIDQGFTGAPRYDATVIDVEPGAWSPTQVTGWMNNATAARPTIYVNRTNAGQAAANALASPRFKGDVWLSYPGWQPGQTLPSLPGCRYIAIQNDFRNPAYDLSVVLDPYWPLEAPMPRPQLQQDVEFCSLCGAFFYGPAAVQACPGNADGQHVSAGTGPFALIYAGN